VKCRAVNRLIIVGLIVGVCVGLPSGVVCSAPSLRPSGEVEAMLKCKGVMIGYEDGSMRWETTISRAEAVKILLTAIGEVAPSLSRTPSVFLDVRASHWAFPFITMAFEVGLVKGRPGRVFDPEQAVTMAEFMVMVSRVYDSLGSQSEVGEPPITIEPAWAAPEIVRWPDLVELVLEESLSVNLDYPASRGEVGVLTARMMERLGLAYDLAGTVERLDQDGKTLLLRPLDGSFLVEVRLSGDVRWFVNGVLANPQGFVGRSVKVALDASGRGSVVVGL